MSLIAAPLLAVVIPSQGGAAEDYPLRVVGSLPEVKGAPKDPTSQHSVLAVDAPSRRMFLLHLDTAKNYHVVTYDLRSRIPRQVGIGKVGMASQVQNDFPIANNYSTAFDGKRSNLAMLSPTIYKDGHAVQAETPVVVVYNDTQHKVVDRWNLIEKIPGFYSMGITYSPADDLYYAVGEFSQERLIANGFVFAGGAKPAGPASAVVALDPVTGTPKWTRIVPECQQVLYSNGIGSLIGRSRVHRAVYFTCVSGGSTGGQTYPGQAGVVRLAIDPKGVQAEAPTWPLEFFPISGNYYAGGTASGVVAFDPTTDRFYVQSLSFKTPGAFVFDGRLSAWVGFVAAQKPINYYIGLNEGMGHLYMGLTTGGSQGAADGIVVADVRQTPVPAGDVSKLVTSALIVTDAKTNRLFVRPRDVTQPYLVVEDVMPVTNGQAGDDYDADTTDTPDTPDAQVFYSLGATGYGAQAVQIGGTSAPTTAIGSSSDGLNLPGKNTRAFMSSRVGAINLRTNAASAAAQAALPDYNTITELEGDGHEWPYGNATCLDAGGEPTSRTTKYQNDTGETTIVCDLAKAYVKAEAKMGESANGGMIVGRTSYLSEAWRNRKEGGVVKTRATADGIRYDVQGGVDIRISRVVSTAVSSAHGRPGTARSTWTREIDGIRVLSGGTPIYTAPGCASEVVATGAGVTRKDTCESLAATLNKLMPTRFKVEFPMPRAEATPKGAFSGIEQSLQQYFNQSVINEQGVVYRGDSLGLRPSPAMITETYNDTTERSRTIAALAATQSNTIFTVVPPYDDGWVDPGVPVDPGPGPSGGNPGVTPVGNNGATGGGDGGAAAPPQAAGPGGSVTTIPAADVRGFLFMRRSVRDTVLLVLFGGLLLAGAGTAWRRRRLVDVLVTVPRKEATS